MTDNLSPAESAVRALRVAELKLDKAAHEAACTLKALVEDHDAGYTPSDGIIQARRNVVRRYQCALDELVLASIHYQLTEVA